MYAWEAIQDSLDYIETHYSEEIELEKLASVAHLSLYYYQRLFYKLVNKTVAEYIKLRRLAKASQYLKSSNRGILEIALECGFKGHSHFTKSFKETFSITPDYYRKHNIQLDQFVKPDLKLLHVMIDINTAIVVQEMVLEINIQELKENRLYIGKSKVAPIKEIGEAKRNDLVILWNQLPWEELSIEPSSQVAADILTLAEDPEKFNYFVGIENINKKNFINYESRIMPKGKYAVCSYESIDFDTLVNEALYKASKYLYEVWLVNLGIEPESILIQKYFNPFKENCYIELWAKIKE